VNSDDISQRAVGRAAAAICFAGPTTFIIYNNALFIFHQIKRNFSSQEMS
jgi:hypothetical protein